MLSDGLYSSSIGGNELGSFAQSHTRVFSSVGLCAKLAASVLQLGVPP